MYRSSCVLSIAVVLGLLCVGAQAESIVTYGAIPNDSSLATAWSNSAAITKALLAASATAKRAADGSMQIVSVPADQVFYFMPVNVTDIHYVTLQIDGTLIAPNNISAWPVTDKHKGSYADMILITDSTNLKITGTGTVDGQGYDWWLLGLLAKLKHHRGK